MNARSQRLCMWSGAVFAVLFFVGFGLIARFIPPPDPANSAEVVAGMYRHHADAIRWGMVVSMFALVFYVPWAAAVSVQLRRIEGRHTPSPMPNSAWVPPFPSHSFPPCTPSLTPRSAVVVHPS